VGAKYSKLILYPLNTKVHISTTDLPFVEAYDKGALGITHIKIVEARLEELDIN
jgi:hypothetical protein